MICSNASVSLQLAIYTSHITGALLDRSATGWTVKFILIPSMRCAILHAQCDSRHADLLQMASSDLCKTADDRAISSRCVWPAHRRSVSRDRALVSVSCDKRRAVLFACVGICTTSCDVLGPSQPDIIFAMYNTG